MQTVVWLSSDSIGLIKEARSNSFNLTTLSLPFINLESYCQVVLFRRAAG